MRTSRCGRRWTRTGQRVARLPRKSDRPCHEDSGYTNCDRRGPSRSRRNRSEEAAEDEPVSVADVAIPGAGTSLDRLGTESFRVAPPANKQIAVREAAPVKSSWRACSACIRTNGLANRSRRRREGCRRPASPKPPRGTRWLFLHAMPVGNRGSTSTTWSSAPEASSRSTPSTTRRRSSGSVGTLSWSTAATARTSATAATKPRAPRKS